MKAPRGPASASASRHSPGTAASAGRTALAVIPQFASADVDALDGLFKGFADPTRIRILNVLVAGELCVCDIVELLDVSQPTASRHLAYLRRSGLVEATRAWKFAHYRLATPTTAVHVNLIACVRSCFLGIESLDSERARADARVRERAAEPC